MNFKVWLNRLLHFMVPLCRRQKNNAQVLAAVNMTSRCRSRGFVPYMDISWHVMFSLQLDRFINQFLTGRFPLQNSWSWMLVNSSFLFNSQISKFNYQFIIPIQLFIPIVSSSFLFIAPFCWVWHIIRGESKEGQGPRGLIYFESKQLWKVTIKSWNIEYNIYIISILYP